MNLRIEILQECDVSEKYVNWFSNEEVVQFSDNQYRKFTLEGQFQYVRSCIENNSLDLYGIFDGAEHIGNICIHGLTSPHKRAELTYVVGDTDYWGKGVGTFAVAEIIKKARNEYGLERLYAGLANGNIGSRRVLEKNGFKLEGTRKKHLKYRDATHDQLDFGLLLTP